MERKYKMLTTEDEKSLLRWWAGLVNERGNRAMLRRAVKPEDVLLSPAFSEFLAIMPESWRQDYRLLDSALIAAILARVKASDEHNTFAKSLALPKQGGGKPPMSELRFMQLQKSRDPDEFFRQLARAISILDGKVNLLSLADGALHWLKEYRCGADKEPIKRLAVRWATDYYTAF